MLAGGPVGPDSALCTVSLLQSGGKRTLPSCKVRVTVKQVNKMFALTVSILETVSILSQSLSQSTWGLTDHNQLLPPPHPIPPRLLFRFPQQQVASLTVGFMDVSMLTVSGW